MATDLANFRRARPPCHVRLKQAEDLAQSCRDKLADLESRIRAIAPELALPGRFRRPNPVFARTELTRLALAILREAGEPLPIAAVAVRALKAKGVAWPDPATTAADQDEAPGGVREAAGTGGARAAVGAPRHHRCPHRHRDAQSHLPAPPSCSVQNWRERALHFIGHSITDHQLQEQVPHIFQRADRTDREAVAILSLQLHELGV